MAETLAVRQISLRFGGVKALTDVSFAVEKGELFSIIGPNGAGKTSMINCISGRYKPSEGQILLDGRDITKATPNQRPKLGIGRTFQNLALFHHMTVLDNILVGRHHLMRNNFVTGSLYWLPGCGARNWRIAAGWRRSSISSTSRPTARRPPAPSPTACASGWNWPVPWRWSPS